MDRSIPAAVPAQTRRPAPDSAERLNRRQKPPSCGHFSGNPRHLFWERGKNSGRTSEKSIKTGGEWRFFEGRSAISTSVYKTGTGAETAGMLGVTSARPGALVELTADNSKTKRHLRPAE
jgi:hypothetical protein